MVNSTNGAISFSALVFAFFIFNRPLHSDSMTDITVSAAKMVEIRYDTAKLRRTNKYLLFKAQDLFAYTGMAHVTISGSNRTPNMAKSSCLVF